MCSIISYYLRLLTMQKIEVGRRWADRCVQLNLNQDFFDKTGMTNTITRCSNECMVSVKNYLVYGLRDNYIRLLKKLKVVNYKMVGLKVLQSLVKERQPNFSFKLSSDGMTFLRMRVNLTEDLNKNIEDEITHMPEMASYNSAFAFCLNKRSNKTILCDTLVINDS